MIATDLDECKTDYAKACDDKEDCINTMGSFTCTCKLGYKYDEREICQGK